MRFFDMTRSIELSNGKFWRTYGEAMQHFSEMLGRYSVGVQINDEQDHEDLLALLIRYDSVLDGRKPSKIGCGIKYFTKENNIEFNWSTDGFWLHRIDGSSSDFSIKKALGPLPLR
jgi:hypothetical protein